MIKKHWKNILMFIGMVFMFMYFFHPKTEEVEVPLTVEVPVPIIEKEFDTIYEPEPIYIKGDVIKEVDSVYYEKYLKLTNDSIKKDSLFKEAITINTYKETIEDDTLTISLNATVRGELLNYQLGYKTKPRTIPLDTVLKIEIPTKAKLFGGFELTMPTNNTQTIDNQPIISAKVYLKTKKDRLWSAGFNNRKQVTIGYAWKF